MNRRMRLFAVLWMAVIAAVATAEVKLPSIFADHMVLQADQPIRLWGWAKPGQKITVTLGQATATATAQDQGRWSVQLPARKPSNRPTTVTIKSPDGTVTLSDVLIGEVWLCSGQSNMQLSMTRVTNAQQEIAEAKYPKIRLFMVPLVTARTPQNNCGGDWQACTPQTVRNFSAVGYFFGRHLHKALGVPVGLIRSAWGGTPVESWISNEKLESIAQAKPLLAQWRQQAAAYDPAKAKAAYEKALAKWREAVKKAKASGKRTPRKPRLAGDPHAHPHYPASLYNAMIHPLVPLSLRGAIWYQGESNVSRAYQYRALMPALIRDWRRRFDNPDLYFAMVQLAPFDYGPQRREMLPELWEAQLMTLKAMDKVGMAVTTDIATIHNIHPPNKQDVGRRLGLWAMATAYGRNNLVYSGPIYQSMKTQGDRIVLTFDHVGSGLTTRDGKPPSDFTIAGADKKFYPAEAKIVGQTVVVHSNKVNQPVAVRFGWSNTAEPNLTNKEGLPASPFRTDRWPGRTEGVLTR